MARNDQESTTEIREARARISEARKQVAERAQQIGNDALIMRCIVGMPIPDGEEWGLRMLKFQLGLAALIVRHRDHGDLNISPQHREWLRHPVTDQLPNDKRLKQLIKDTTRKE